MTMKKHTGFTLVELLIVLVMLAVVMTAVYSLYVTHQRYAYTQEEVVDVQQNLRIAMDSMTRDIKMAGFLIPNNDDIATANNRENTPVGNVSYNAGWPQPLPAPDNRQSDVITVNTSSASGTYAWIVNDQPGGEPDTTFTVDSSESVNAFSNDDNVVIIRTERRSLVPAADTVFRVTGHVGQTLRLTRVSGTSPGGTNFTRGDVIAKLAKKASGANVFPNSVTYCIGPAAGCGEFSTSTVCPIGQKCLMRIVNDNTADVVATNIVGLEFSYIAATTETNAVAAASLDTIRSVRVTIMGRTSQTIKMSDGVPWDRRLTSVIRLRNRVEEE